jgi:hypothetical protein
MKEHIYHMKYRNDIRSSESAARNSRTGQRWSSWARACSAMIMIWMIPGPITAEEGSGDPGSGELQDIKLILRDDNNTASSERDSTDTTTDTPTLYCYESGGNVRVNLTLEVEQGNYSWTIFHVVDGLEDGLDGGTLPGGDNYSAISQNLPATDMYTLEVRKDGDPSFLRQIRFGHRVELDIRESFQTWNRVGRDDTRTDGDASNKILIFATAIGAENWISFDLVKPPDISGPVWFQVGNHFERIDGESKMYSCPISTVNNDADCLVQYGFDANKDGALAGDEIRGTYEVYGVTGWEFATARDWYHDIYLPYVTDLSDQLHRRFADGAFNPGAYAPTSSTTESLDGARRLTHCCGVTAPLVEEFETLAGRKYYKPTVPMTSYIYGFGSDACELIRTSTRLRNGLNAFVNQLSKEAIAYGLDHSSTTFVSFSLDGTTFNLGVKDIGLGHVTVDSRRYHYGSGTITLSITRNGSGFVIAQQAAIEMRIEDPFDFDYFSPGYRAEVSGVPRNPAMVQNGFSKAGGIPAGIGEVGLVDISVSGYVTISGRTIP